ncbi:MAG: threonine synthase, partial [Paenibacillus sp.]|nr:threonine synthase [Paenibacillus sp.]
MRYMGLLHKYKEFLPVTERTPLLTLHEGNTPLVRADKLSDELDLDIYFK